MSYDSHTPDSPARPLIDRFGFSHLLATTVVLVVATILLGVATKAYGAGLACDANWPLCDAGPYNLFPASVPSFFEWIHRFVAMFAGFAIVGTAIAAVRSSSVDRTVTAAVVLGMVLTPIQVILGRETVLQYELIILDLHFWTAVLIFVLFAAAAALVWAPRMTETHVTAALVVGAAAVPAQLALSPLFVSDITTYSPPVQTTQYAVTLALFASVILAAIVGRRLYDDARVTGLLSATPALALLVILLGRRAVMSFDATVEYLYVAASVALFVAFLVGIRLVLTSKAGAGAR